MSGKFINKSSQNFPSFSNSSNCVVVAITIAITTTKTKRTKEVTSMQKKRKYGAVRCNR